LNCRWNFLLHANGFFKLWQVCAKTSRHHNNLSCFFEVYWSRGICRCSMLVELKMQRIDWQKTTGHEYMSTKKSSGPFTLH
jgi:hypothetical protein